jgi:hypothetical protein
MTDYDKRYASAAQMLLDLETVRQAEDPFAVTPAMLPSMRVGLDDTPFQPAIDPMVGQVAAAGAAAAQAAPRPQPAGFGPAAAAGVAAGVAGVGRPRIRVVNWWTGRHEVEHPAQDSPTAPHAGPAFGFPGAAPPPPWPPKPEEVARYAQHVAAGAMGSAGEALRKAGEALRRSGDPAKPAGPRTPGVPAHEQLARARSRMEERRRRAADRLHLRRKPTAEFRAAPNRGVIIAVVAMVGLFVWISSSQSRRPAPSITARSGDWSSVSGSISPEVLLPDVPDPRELVDEAMASAREGQDAAIQQLEGTREELRARLQSGELGRVAAGRIQQHIAEIDASIAQLQTQVGATRNAAPAVVRVEADADDMPADKSPADMAFWRERDSGVDAVYPVEAQLMDAWADAESTAIVVIDIPKPLSAAQEKAITNALLAVAHAGVRLVGDYPHNPAIEVDSTRQLDMVARMLAARGIEPADSEKAKANVQKWLVGEADIDAAVWIRSAQDPLRGVEKAGKPKPAQDQAGESARLAFTVVSPEVSRLGEDRREKVTEVVRRIAETLSGESGQ